MSNGELQNIITIVAIAFLVIGVAMVFPAGFMSVAIYIDVVYVILAAYGIQAVYQFFKYAKSQSITMQDLFPGVISDKFIIGFAAVGSMGWLAANFVIDLNWYINFVLWVFGSLGLLKLSTSK